MSSDVRWNGPAYTAAIKRHLLRKLNKVGEAVVARVKENIATQGPPPSVEGEYPHRQTGDLQASVEFRVDAATLSVILTANADHAKYVEASRPFLARTLQEMANVGTIARAMVE